MRKISIRKTSIGKARPRFTLLVTPHGYHCARERSTVSSVRVPLPPALMALLGWRPGWPIRVRASANGIECRSLRQSSTARPWSPKKSSCAQRVRFARRYAEVLQQLSRSSASRHWSICSSASTRRLTNMAVGASNPHSEENQ